MPITDAQARDCAADFAERIYVKPSLTANLPADAIKDAIAAQVTFIESNTTAINNAFPEPFKSTATVAQKRVAFGLAALKLSGLLG